MADRPLVGVTGPDQRLRWGWWAARRAVLRAGGSPLHLTPLRTSEPPPIAGLVIGGGSDVDPSLYDPDAKPAPDPARDVFELMMIEWALARDVPLLGICRGAQLLNVVHGGNLLRDIRPLRRLTSNQASLLPRKHVRVDEGSRLAILLGATALPVNSLHWQAVDRVGRGLRAVARDRDGIVQGLEADGGTWCFGVQWHPEYLQCLAPHAAIFRGLVRAAHLTSRR